LISCVRPFSVKPRGPCSSNVPGPSLNPGAYCCLPHFLGLVKEFPGPSRIAPIFPFSGVRLRGSQRWNQNFAGVPRPVVAKTFRDSSSSERSPLSVCGARPVLPDVPPLQASFSEGCFNFSFFFSRASPPPRPREMPALNLVFFLFILVCCLPPIWFFCVQDGL